MVRGQRVWRALPRHPIRAFLVVAFTLSILLILAACFSATSSTMPSFQFLAGRSPIPMVRDQDQSRNRGSLDFYSFAGDFESVCTAARSELTALGYTELPKQPDAFYDTREFQLCRNTPDGMILIRIMAHARLVVFSTPKNSQYSSPDRYSYRPESDWVSVEVAQQRYGGPWQGVKARVDALLWRMGLLK